ncbi:MAG: DUF4249 family protein [Cyclobacteriaceae bacterium]
MKKFIYILATLSLASCLETIDWPGQNTSSGTLVIEGNITTQLKQHLVKLTYTQPVIVDEFPDGATGAVVTISDGAIEFPLTEIEPGLYLTDSIVGQVGKTYVLSIELNGQFYEATAPLVALNANPSPIELITAIVHPPNREPFEATTYTYRSNFGQGFAAFYRFAIVLDQETIENDDELPEQFKEAVRANNYVVTDSAYYMHPSLEPPGFLAYGETTESRTALSIPGTKVIEEFHSMTDEHYSFVRAMLSETEWRGLGPFGYIPGEVQSNISNGAFGYFSASEVVVIEQVPFEKN